MLRITQEQLDEAVEFLRAGGVIVYPTETTYGLGCDATNPQAVERIFVIKGRERTKALPVIIPDKNEAGQYIEISEAAQTLMDDHWPGALNIIAPVAENSPIVPACAGNGMQSIRVSAHPFASAIARRFGRPIVATSANISGQDAIYSTKRVEELFADRPDRPDYIVDGGGLPGAPPSTTVVVKGDDVQVVRQGYIQV